MLILHLSDIHFREPNCVNPQSDPERPFRTRLINDLRARTRELGNVDAIIVGGDIAFKAHPAEYAAAREWIADVAAASGCPIERVYVVPGNHDVDRRAIQQSVTVRNAHEAIRGAPFSRREAVLRAHINDEEAWRSILRPLEPYNEFAKYYNCQIYGEHLAWRQEIPLADGLALRIHGLTSVLLSGSGPSGDDVIAQSLYLSPLQTAIDPVDDVVNLVVCHHPPDWLMDNDEVDEILCSRAAIHLFGHKHRNRITKDDTYVRFSAGAVNPDRTELGWCPAYNLINLSVEGTGADRALVVDAHLLELQSNPERYRPKQTSAGQDVHKHVIPIPCLTSPVRDHPAHRSQLVVDAELRDSLPAAVLTQQAADPEAAMGSTFNRNLVSRFWDLDSSDRRHIASVLGLLNDVEFALPEPERYGIALVRASERGLLDQVATEVSRREHH